MSTKDLRTPITPTHILGSTGTLETSDLGYATVQNTANILGPLTATTRAVRSDATDTGSVTTSHLRTVVASQDSTASGIRSAVVASQDSTASGNRSAVVASTGSTASGTSSVIVGGAGTSAATASVSAVINTESGTASGTRSAVMASAISAVTATQSVIVGSLRTINETSTSLALGTATSGDASTSNRTIHLFGITGNASIAGTLTQTATFTDFAEMMPNGTGAEIAAGTLLTLDDGAVRPADEGEEICGVVSHTAAVLAGDTPFCWQGRYLHDEFGKRLYETIPDADWEPGEGETEDDRPMQNVLKENPDWNPDLPQTPRSERPDEWTPVGMVGQVYVRTGEQVQPGDRIGAKEGMGYQSVERTGLKVISVTKDYDGEYGIARCLINIMV